MATVDNKIAARRQMRIECLPIIEPLSSDAGSFFTLGNCFPSLTNIDDMSLIVYFVYHAASNSLHREGTRSLDSTWMVNVASLMRAQTRQDQIRRHAGKDSRSGDSAVQQVWLSPNLDQRCRRGSRISACHGLPLLEKERRPLCCRAGAIQRTL